MMKRFLLLCINLILCGTGFALGADTVAYELSFDAAIRSMRIGMSLETNTNEYVDLKMPVWSPGYYQLMDYAAAVSNVQAWAADGEKPLQVSRPDASTWRVNTGGQAKVRISYSVKEKRRFVACNALDSAHAYIVPTATFLYPNGQLDRPVQLTLHAPKAWPDVATGLEPHPSLSGTYCATDFDILYDSPLLMGKLTQLPTTYVGDVPHYFYAHQVEEGDYTAFAKDLESIVSSASQIIGEVPFKHYTFIGIGEGQGGIEHLNSTAVSFSAPPADFNQRRRLMSFLAHEYFHHYNAKRIRPIALGPFDYSQANRTKMLWVAEGLTVYYEAHVLNRAGLLSPEDVLQNWSDQITTYEASAGKSFQTLAEASEQTWEDGPFGERAEKKISYYQKGPLIGILLDLRIRQATGSAKSLDDVMRYLYYHYYKEAGRGYTEQEFRQVCEAIAGIDLQDLFDYVYTTKPIDYNTYLQLAGLELQQANGKYVIVPVKQRTEEQALLWTGWLKSKN